MNRNAADTTNTDQLWSAGGLGLDLTGAGITVGVWDEDRVRSTHQEFGSRVAFGDAASGLSNHATHVAGTIGAAGIVASAHGMANEVSIRSYDWDNDDAEMYLDASLIQVSNHSYGFATGWEVQNWPGVGNTDVWWEDRAVYGGEDPDFGKYDDHALDLDEALYERPYLLSVWAAGNDRNDQFSNVHGDGTYVSYFSSGLGLPGWYQVSTAVYAAPAEDGNGGTGYDSLPVSQVAKNGLVVGAINDITVDPYGSGNVSMASFSSWGPTDDGRVKPDIVANGVSLYSPTAGSDTAYGTYSGTSMAAPNATGSAALLIQHYQNLHGAAPRSATTKGVLIHNAFDAGNLGPDYSFGWGVLDAAAAATFLSATTSVDPSHWVLERAYDGTEWTWQVESDGTTPLKATIVWTDLPGPLLDNDEVDYSTSVLTNDLDIWISGPGGTFLPWTLDPLNPASPAVQTQANHRDNVEQVVIATPGAGVYSIHVGHSGSSFLQDYSILVSGARSVAGDTTPPTVTALNPSAGATIGTSSVDIDVTFSETVVGVDSTDLVLSGTAAAGASVGAPLDLGGNTWRFPVSGLVSGILDLTLAPDPNDIEDTAGNDLAPTAWNHAVMPDLVALSFTADGFTAVTVTFEVLHGAITPFEIGFYRSADVSFGGDELLTAVVIDAPADLTVGVHAKSFAIGSASGAVALPTDGTELQGDYFLLAIIDHTDALVEADADPFSEDNIADFAGVYHPSGGAVYVHGSAGNDAIAVASGSIDIDVNGVLYSYANADVAAVRVRAHAGNDVVSGANGPKPMLLIGGAGNDSLVGGGGADTLDGGAGNDTLVGGAGNDNYLFDADAALGTDTLNEAAGGVDTLDFSATTGQTIVVSLATSTAQIVNPNLSVILGSSSTFENVIGGDLDDRLTGNSLANTIAGGAGNDTLVGSSGNDVYLFDCDGPLGIDTVTDSGGVDRLDFAATSAQSIAFNLSLSASQVVNANLTLILTGTLEHVTGGALADTITGNTAANSLVGGSGSDTLVGGSGNDTLVGGAGNDTLSGEAGNDMFFGEEGDDSLVGGTGNDVFVFDTDLGLGNDVLTELASGGTDTLDFSASSLAVTIDLGLTTPQDVNGNLRLTMNLGNSFENLVGGAGDDRLTGNSLSNRITGGAGNDTMTGGTGSDVYVFDADTAIGSDSLIELASGGGETLDFSATSLAVAIDLSNTSTQVVNGNLAITLNLGNTFEHLLGGAGADLLIGNTLANNLTGGAGDDTLVGGAGNDVYLFDADAPLGSDTLDESSGGTDTLNFSSTSTRNINLDLSQSATQIVNANHMLALGSGSTFEHVIGGSQADTLIGNALANSLTGNAGNDTIRGGSGADTLTGGAGNDSLQGEAGDDRYPFDTDSALGTDTVDESTGSGADTLDFSGTSTRTIAVDLSRTVSQSVNPNLTLILAGDVEHVLGGALGDAITGNALANNLDGRAGNDTIVAGAGADTLVGGAGNDSLVGGAGDDVYPFDADAVLGNDTLDEADGGRDLLDFGLTSTRTIALNLGLTGAQVVNSNLTLTLLSGLTFEMVIGGSLGDALTGNGLDNLLIGGAGNDTLVGGTGRDLLVGGAGADSIEGGSGEDILIAGKLTYYNESTKVLNRGAIDAIMAEWTRPDADFATRVANLRNGSGLNGSTVLNSTSVLDDGSAIDSLLGGDDFDWFWAWSLDLVIDRQPEEPVN